MEIYLDNRALRQIRLSVSEAIEEGDTENLRDDLVRVFSTEDTEEIERRVDSGDIYDFISEVLEEWSMEDLDELLELLEAHLTDADIELKFGSPDGEEEPEEVEVDDAEEPDEELDDDADDDADEDVEEAAEEDF
ncbi:MAG: hypothetical protein IPG17_06110 [Sandaracinaceae bacterium]|nr:hypothetical protein [Sandaracinaceae bacterium]MBP7683792.1 hypothetical protein [Deltaproteobacteria bacterium]MBK6807742.1 hypothetical protein [Sandaracinaceae bacterium]MBK7154114.1 hypothetical protein [Sandaracinaceae bacterium]MBK7776259.1 hypothetical protein [Sandaracinaceae bacterium]